MLYISQLPQYFQLTFMSKRHPKCNISSYVIMIINNYYKKRNKNVCIYVYIRYKYDNIKIYY